MILSTAYLGNIHYFSKLITGQAVLDLQENYVKQSYRNRCVILSSNGPLTLTVPVLQPSGIKTRTCDIRIDPSKRWQHQHHQAIVSAYRNSPFYEHYADTLLAHYSKTYHFLCDLNLALQETLFTLLGTHPTVELSDGYCTDIPLEEDFRLCISPKDRLQRVDPSFESPHYYQVFSDSIPFAPNLSIIDLLFCEGPATIKLLQKTIVRSI